MHRDIVPSRPIEDLSPEVLVYLFADKFLDIDGRTPLTGHSSPQAPIEQISMFDPAARVAVAQMMYLATVIWLATLGIAKLGLEQGGFLFFRSEGTVFQVLRMPTFRLPGLQGEILGAAHQYPGDRRVSDLVRDSLGQPQSDPWGQIIGVTERTLLEQDLLSPERCLITDRQENDLLEQAARSLRGVIEDFMGPRRRLCEQLRRDIARGIASRPFAWYA